MEKRGFTPSEKKMQRVDAALSLWYQRSGLTSRRTRARHSLAGFTLIEIMLVVIILGVLAAMVVPRLAGRSEEARKSIAKTDIESNIPLALDLYEVDTGSFPAELEDLRVEPSGAQNWKGPYLKKKPVDPWGREYLYKYPGEHNTASFDLYSLGKDGVEGGDDDVVNWDE